jgi:hypothetical protein
VGPHRYVTPGIVFKGELITTDLVEINLAIADPARQLVLRRLDNEETFVTQDPLGNPVDKRHPWNKVTLPKPQKRDFTDKYTWVVSPRIYDKRNDTYVACDTGGGPFARQWVTAKAGLVDIGYLKATGSSIQMVLPKTGGMPEMELEWTIPEKSNAIERDRARDLPPGLLGARRAAQPREGAGEIRAGRTKSWTTSRCPRGVSVGFHEAARGVLSHHMVIRDGKIANYQPYPPTPWNANPRDVLRHARPLRGRRPEHADLRGERAGELQGRGHHAGRPLVRPVPAVRRAHVHRGGTRAQGRAPADRPVLMRRRSGLRAAPRPRAGAHRRARGASGRAARRTRRGPHRRDRRAVRRRAAAVVEALEEPARRAGDPRTARRRRRGREPAAHPRPVPDRPRDAGQRGARGVRPYMESHGGDVELLGLADGVARLRLVGQLRTAARRRPPRSSSRSGRARQAAPDSAGLEVEGVRAPREDAARAAPTSGPLDGARPAPATWRPASCAASTLRGAELVVANVEGRCWPTAAPAPAAAPARATRRSGGEILTARAAGAPSTCRAPGARSAPSRLQLEPVPLLGARRRR